MSDYLIYQYKIIDKTRIEELGPLSLAIIEKYSGELVVASGMNFLEGNSTYNNILMHKFSSLDAAKFFTNLMKQVNFQH